MSWLVEAPRNNWKNHTKRQSTRHSQQPQSGGAQRARMRCESKGGGDAKFAGQPTKKNKYRGMLGFIFGEKKAGRKRNKRQGKQ